MFLAPSELVLTSSSFNLRWRFRFRQRGGKIAISWRSWRFSAGAWKPWFSRRGTALCEDDQAACMKGTVRTEVNIAAQSACLQLGIPLVHHIDDICTEPTLRCIFLYQDTDNCATKTLDCRKWIMQFFTSIASDIVVIPSQVMQDLSDLYENDFVVGLDWESVMKILNKDPEKDHRYLRWRHQQQLGTIHEVNDGRAVSRSPIFHHNVKHAPQSYNLD